MGLLGHMVVLFIVFKEISIVAVLVYIPTVQEGSLFSTSSPVFICRFFDGHSDWCEVIPHCSFDLHFSNNERQLHLSHTLVK